MFQNRISGFDMHLGDQQDRRFNLPSPYPEQASQWLLRPVQIADIYQAARQRAIEEHELDKLFNPDFYDYQI
jgi:hypothetical protein